MLTHQKTKPFACMEQGCSMSCGDDRSLRRHYEIQHGLCIVKERPPQLPPTLVSGQEGGTLPAGLPLIQGQAAPASAEPSNHNLQWLQNLPGCPASEENDVFTIQKPTSVSPQEGSESGPRPSSTSLTGGPSPSGGRRLEDALPLPPTYLKAPGEASDGPGYAGEEGDTRASKKSDSDSDACSWQHVEEPGLQEALKPSGLSSDNMTPLSGQLFLKSQECLMEKVKMDTHCEASPSQVAMTSFSSAGPSVDTPQDSKSKLMISNRIQDGNTYRLPDPVKEESTAGGCNQQNGGPADWAEPRSTYVCKNCSQMFHTQEGLTSHTCFPNDQWLSPRGNQDQQVSGTEFFRPPSQALRVEVEAQSPPGAMKPPDGMSTAPLGMPLGPVSRTPGSTAKAENPGSGSGVVAALGSLAEPGLDRVLDVTFPSGSMGSALACARTPLKTELCTHGLKSPPVALNSLLQGQDRDQEERDGKETSQPRKRRKRLQPKASFLPPAPSASGGPGPEEGHQSCLQSPVLLVDHSLQGLCPHSSDTPPPVLSPIREGSGLDSSTLCSMSTQAGPDKLISTELGSAIWTPTEKELFNKAFQAHKNNFSLIHKMVQTKSVAQCVEYYYTWKKRVRFTTSSQAPGLKKSVKRKLGESDPTETKATASPKKRRKHHPTPELKTETESCRGQSVANTSPNAAPKQTPEPPGCVQGQGAPCGECERVFDKMWTRYAHMKRHRVQDPMETTVGEERPAKAFKVEEEEKEEKEEEGEMGADIGPLQGDLGCEPGSGSPSLG
ncbi:Zinc finger protein 541 [Manis javanica]|nr:Zinc finger protein 541 [Manis javanica]